MKFYKAWHYLENHPIFKDSKGVSRFKECIDIEVVKVNPENNTIDEDELLNTKTKIWLECGPYKENFKTHSWDLDCGASTFEKAIIKLAKKVKKEFGNNEKEALEKVKALYPDEPKENDYKEKLKEIEKES